VPNHSAFRKRIDSRVTRSSSRNAVSISSERATKRFPSSRCASAIQIVHPLQSTVATQPHVHPDAVRLSAMISQYFITLWARSEGDFKRGFEPAVAIHHKLDFLHLSLLGGLIFKSGILLRIPANEGCLQARFEPRVRVSWGVLTW